MSKNRSSSSSSKEEEEENKEDMYQQYDSIKRNTSSYSGGSYSTSLKGKENASDSSNRSSMKLHSSDNIQRDKHQTGSSRRSLSRSPSPKGSHASAYQENEHQPRGTTTTHKQSKESKYL